ncbi:MAG TPA: hypothetical protein VL240_07690 [Candidatus Binatia bacterium]|nr:hypothetical protein [Candidatus Binatia bacterium]
MNHYAGRFFSPAFVALLVLFLDIFAAAQTVSPELLRGLQWRLIGPFRGGRAVAVTGVPDGGATFYFGSVNGGVWKTTDAGVTWAPIFDGQPIASIGALEVAPSNPDVLYAGTGESDIRSALSSGDGVYKSSDGGKTWRNIGLRDSRQISRIVVDPRNGDIVYVGVLGHAYGPNDTRGVYRSSDGGNTWTRVLDRGPNIGVSDLALAAANPDILFAGTWNSHRPPWSTYAPLQGPGGGLYRSTDSGASWTQLSGNGLPDGDWGRVGVAVAPDGKRIYALIDAGEKSGLYRSEDGGNSWTLANSDSRLTSRAWYFMGITVDPNNRDVIYMPNVALYRSEDGGKTISIVRGAPGGDDYHQLWVDPKNSSHLVLGTDQGTTVSLNRGQTWSTWYNQPTAQLYHVITDNEFPYHVYGAQQDTGAVAVPNRTDHGLITGRDWYMVGGGESGWLAPDPADPEILYATGVYGNVVRFNRRTSLSQDITPWPMPNFASEINQRRYRDPWTPMLVLSPAEKNALYLGTQYVMKTTDGGLHWKQISPDLTGAAANAAIEKPTGPATAQNAKERGFGVVFSIAPSPVKPDEIWAGSDTGLLHLKRDGGRSWQDVTPKGLSDWSKIAMIEASRYDPAVAYVAVDRHRLDDQKPYIYRTRDYGQSWQLIATGIPASSFVNAVREDTEKKGLLFAGTELGICISFDDGDHWQPLQLNLPVTSARDIAIHGDDLIVATHGRSFWILDDIALLRQLATGSPASGPRLYRPATAVRIDNDFFLGTPLPPDEPSAKNPPDGAIVDYYLPSAAKSLTLEIFDSGGKLVRGFTAGPRKQAPHPPLPIAERWIPKPVVLENTAGAHRFVWDLRWASTGANPETEEEEGFGAPRGPRALPGSYQVKLTADGATLTQPLIVQMDSRARATTAELNEQLRLGLEIFNQVRSSRRALAEIAVLKKRLSEINGEVLAKHADVTAQLTNLNAAIGKIEKGDNPQPGSISGLTSASTGLAAALRVVESNDRAIPSQAEELYRQADQEARAALATWKNLKSTQLPKLNEALQKAGVEAVRISEIRREAEYLSSQ